MRGIYFYIDIQDIYFFMNCFWSFVPFKDLSIVSALSKSLAYSQYSLTNCLRIPLRIAL